MRMISCALQLSALHYKKQIKDNAFKNNNNNNNHNNDKKNIYACKSELNIKLLTNVKF